MLEYWIWLAHCPELTDRQKWNLLRQFGTPEAIYHSGNEICRVEGMTDQAVKAVRAYKLSEAQKIMKKSAEERFRIIVFDDEAYPARLKNIYDPPMILYCKGKLPDFDSLPVIGVVGTRNPSAYGSNVAQRLGFEITRCGGVVVSGLAAGIDGSAMRGALSAPGTVVGVLGCGIDVVYPQSNRGLFQETERYGCILSEFSPGTPPNRWNFPRRNRIISGLSCGVVVVEAPERSGSLITARLANDQGRDVFVVPGNVDMPGFVGSNQLLRDGAMAVSCGWDVMSEYQMQYPDKIHRDNVKAAPKKQPGNGQNSEEKPEGKNAPKSDNPGAERREIVPSAEKVIDKGHSAPYIDLSKKLATLSDAEQTVIRAVGTGERLVDDVISESGLSAGKVLGILTMLELKRMIVRLPGKRVTLKK